MSSGCHSAGEATLSHKARKERGRGEREERQGNQASRGRNTGEVVVAVGGEIVWESRHLDLCLASVGEELRV